MVALFGRPGWMVLTWQLSYATFRREQPGDVFFWRTHGVFNAKKFEIWTTDYKLAVCCISVKQIHSNVILDYDFSLRFLMSSWNLRMSHLLLFFGRETKGFSVTTKLDFCARCLDGFWSGEDAFCMFRTAHWRGWLGGGETSMVAGDLWMCLWVTNSDLVLRVFGTNLSLKTHCCSVFHSWLDPTYVLLRNMI